jgi:hypothetical protein
MPLKTGFAGGETTMKANAALGFLLTGASLALGTGIATRKACELKSNQLTRLQSVFAKQISPQLEELALPLILM